jgi:autotransporter-associated beta strand protein
MALSGGASLQVSNNETIKGLYGASGTTVTLVSSANLVTTGSSGATFAGSIMGIGSLEIGPGGYQVLNAMNSYSNGTTIDGTGTLQLGDGTNAGSILSTVAVVDNGTLAFDNPGSTNFMNAISGTGGITLNGGIVTLSGANGYTGPTTLNQGTLYVTNASSLGGSTSNVVVNDPVMAPTLAPSGADVAISNAISVPSTGLNLNVSASPYTLTLNGIISNNGPGGTLMINGPVTLNGANTYSGGTTISSVTTAGGVTVGNTSGLGTGPVTATASDLNFTSGSSPSLASADFSGGTTATFAGIPLLTDLTMVASTLKFNGATAQLTDMVSDSLTTNTITLGNNTDLTMYVSNGNETDYHGEINDSAGNGRLNVDGPGVLVLYNTNTFGGGTTVSSGVLVANSSGALGSGEVTVNGVGVLGVGNGYTLTNQIAFSGGGVGGYGTFSPSVASAFGISGGSVISAGRGTITASGDGAGLPVQGQLTFGGSSTLTFGQNGIYEFAIQGAGTTAGVNYSTITVNSSFALAATPSQPFTIEILSVGPSGSLGTDSAFNPAVSQTWTLLTTPTAISGFGATDFAFNTGMFNSGSVPSSAFSVSLGGTGNDSLILNFTPVPEPSTWALMAGGLCAFGAMAVRRRRRA